MKKLILFLGALCVVSAVACNGGDSNALNPNKKAGGGIGMGGAESGGGQTTGACTLRQNSACMEITYSGTPPAGQDGQPAGSLKEECQAQGGVYSDSCTRANALGGCRQTRSEAGFTSSTSTIYYTGNGIDSVERVKQMCAMMHQEFFAP